jgi:hypothetical protein
MKGRGLRIAAIASLIAVAIEYGRAQGHLAPVAMMKETTTMKLSVGESVFVAEMHGNDAARAPLAMLPLTPVMSEQGGKEKFLLLSQVLSAAPGLEAALGKGEVKVNVSRR